MALTPDDIERHRRHILLKEIGGPGVQRLQTASVSIIGAGALGGPCGMYLAAAGVGHIEIWDDDQVDRSNLQRQVQFGECDIGKPKADILAKRLNDINPRISINTKLQRFGAGDSLAGEILIDASDNFETRFALNQLAHQSKRLLVSGAASRWSGQVAVFASGIHSGTPCYRCFVPEMPPQAEACDEVGVVGALTGQVGAAMALEVVKLITDSGDALIGRVHIVDGLSGSSRTVRLRPNPDCNVCSS